MDNRYQRPADFDKSPLRTSQNMRHSGMSYQHHPQSQQTIDEEEAYNRRRSEGLRKLQDMSNSLDRVPVNDRDSSQHFTLGPQIRDEGTYEIAPHMKEHLSNIQNDNASLMRRLNLVTQELERVRREKDELLNRMNYEIKEQNQLSRLINSEDNVDKVNKHMQNDLAYEKERNFKTKQQIKELDMYRNELSRDLSRLMDTQDAVVQENQSNSHSLQQKLTMIEDIEKEYYFTQEKIKATNIAIDRARLENNENQAENIELQRIIHQLIEERNELLDKLEHLTRKYDDCVREISYDRQQMETHNKQHSKLITAKILFNLLDTYQRQRICEGFQEIQSYCYFDNKCHTKLQSFAKVLGNIGRYQQRIALLKWSSNTLKPIGMKKQSYILSIQSQNTNLLQKMFSIWRSKYQQRVENYDSKTRSIILLWERMSKESLVEKKRAFLIWKDTLSQFKAKKQKIRKLLWYKYFKQMSMAMNDWINYNHNLDSQVRMNLLKMNFSHKQYLTILFNNFKYQVTESKRKRQNVLFHTLKAWQDHLRYEKFIMASNVAALNLRKQLNVSLTKHCFDALKEHKETEKYNRTHALLTQKELPTIYQVSTDNSEFTKERQLLRKKQACDTVKTMMSKQLYSYIHHWKKMNDDYNEKLRTTLKDKIIKLYMGTMKKSFNHWKVKDNSSMIMHSQMIVSETQSEQRNLQNEVYQNTREINAQKEIRDQSQKKHTLKCVQSYERRMRQIAIGRWKDQVNDMNIKEDGAATIIRRLRLRFLRKAFDFYANGVKNKKQEIRNEERCQLYRSTRDERIKRQIYHAWTLFKRNHVKAKDYWYRIYIRSDLSMKQQAVKKWKEVAQYKVEKELQQHQHSKVENIEQLNNQIGQMHIDETQQQQEIKEMKQIMTTQARRIISNAFARYYYVNQTRGFEKWKEYVTHQKRREILLRKYIDHWRKNQFYFVKSCFKNWILNGNINERKQQLKKEELKLADTQHNIQQQESQFEQIAKKLQEQLCENQQEQNKYNQRLQKSVGMIIKKVDQNHYTLNKRYIFQQWSEYVKREVRFIHAVKNVIEKSLWKEGLQNIIDHSRQVRDNKKQEVILQLFRMKFWKRTCGNAFSVWRSGKYEIVTQTIQETEQETQNITDQHNNRKVVIKEHNANRSEKILTKNHLKNLFQSWKNVSTFLKTQRFKNNHCLQELEYQQKLQTLIKWNKRKQATKLARIRYNRLKEKVRSIQLRFFFTAMKDQFVATKSLCQRLSNIANVYDLQNLKQSFNAVKSYAKAKSFVFDKNKENATFSIYAHLEALVMKKKRQYLADLKVKCLNKRTNEHVKAFTILNNIGKSMRFYFQKWKKNSDKESLEKEMYEEGPVREQAFEHRIQLVNLTEFMKKEGYDDKEIVDALHDERSRQGSLILKSVKRMQHYNSDQYLKPKCFDRWRQYIHMRKLFKYWLGFADKRSDFIKSDIHWAFDKWRNSEPKQRHTLQRKPKRVLDIKTIDNSHRLEKLSENVEDKENCITHLNDQREDLIGNYIKAQRLSLTLWRNHQKKAMHQAFLRWAKVSKSGRNLEITNNLKENLELLENLKSKIKHLEYNNEQLANENEELRQFSLDGYEIAKNVQALTSEREKLSVDLADKAQMIRKLLDENEKLTHKLRYAQDEAQSFIRSTMAGSSGFKTGQKGYPSPFTKSGGHY